MVTAQDSYRPSRNIVRKFQRSIYVVNTVDYPWEMNLADVSNIIPSNDNYKFLFIVIDVFSKYRWVTPLKDPVRHRNVRLEMKFSNATTGNRYVHCICTVFSSVKKIMWISDYVLDIFV